MTILTKYIVCGLTLLNAMFGCFSIISAFEGYYYLSAYFLIFAILADQIDGRFARVMRQTSAIGRELDSLADAVSFAVAPMVILYDLYLKSIGAAGIALSAGLVLCAIYRLAKFNLTEMNEYFIGVPTPVIAGVALGLVIGDVRLTAFGAGIVVLVLSYLVVSNVPYYNFKMFKKLKKGEKIVISIVTVVLISGLIFYSDFVILACIFAYLLFAPVVWLFVRNQT